jgi:Flp pilus assembly pilin Flp
MTSLRRLWNDDAGALIAIEFLFISTILVVGAVVGLANLRLAVNLEFTELSNSTLALSQGYCFAGQRGTFTTVDGSQACDTPGSLTAPCAPPIMPSIINQLPSN